MGVTAYLELYGSSSFDPGSANSKVLFGAKSMLPVAWFVFFAPEDFVSLKSASDGSVYTLLRCEATAGIARARRRLAALRPQSSPELDETLGSFVDAVERASAPRLLGKLLGRKSVLVLNSHRMESTRATLTGCAKWFDQAADKLTARLFKRVGDLLDGCEGLELLDGQLDVGDPDHLCGGSMDGIWKAPDAQAPVLAPANSVDAARARVWAQPDDLEVRRRCGAELTALGDPRGELITLACSENLSARAEKRLDRLFDSLRDRLGEPFTNVVMFHHGFPIEVEWNARDNDPLVGHPAWSTVQSVRYRGPAPLLHDRVLAHVYRLHATPELLRELAALGQPVAVRSICLRTDRDADAWRALASTTVFPDLREVWVTDPLAVWLPEPVQQLIRARPAHHVNTGSPSVPIQPLPPMTIEEHQARLARWTTPPPGPFLAGPRYDNGFR